MMPEKSTLPGSPRLDASDEVNRAFGYNLVHPGWCGYCWQNPRIYLLVIGGLYIQAVYQLNRGFMQGSMILRILTAGILWGNGLEWRLSALMEVGLAFFSGVVLLLESQAQQSQRKQARK
jgi:hypothetical protein